MPYSRVCSLIRHAKRARKWLVLTFHRIYPGAYNESQYETMYSADTFGKIVDCAVDSGIPILPMRDVRFIHRAPASGRLSKPSASSLRALVPARVHTPPSADVLDDILSLQHGLLTFSMDDGWRSQRYVFPHYDKGPDAQPPTLHFPAELELLLVSRREINRRAVDMRGSSTIVPIVYKQPVSNPPCM